MPISDQSETEVEDTQSKEKLNFPGKLHAILSTPDHQDIIAWLPHGRSWRILQQEKFQEKVLPLFFRHGRHKSFIRQVNGWGFQRITSGRDYNSYYHEHFLRGRLDLCQRMQRLMGADLKARKGADSASPPNFYNMPPVSICFDPIAAPLEAREIRMDPTDVPFDSIPRLPPDRELAILDQLGNHILDELAVLNGDRKAPGVARRTHGMLPPRRGLASETEHLLLGAIPDTGDHDTKKPAEQDKSVSADAHQS